MQQLRDAVNLAMQRFDSLFEHSQVEIKDLSLYLTQQIVSLREKLIANEIQIADQKQTIDSLFKLLNAFQEDYSTKRSVDKIKSDFDLAIKANTVSHINSFQEFQRELKTLIKYLENDLLKLRLDTSLMNGELDKKIDSNFSISRIDKDGVLKEIRGYDKAIFYIEKKIENIYTLIERINKRGEVCHKPE